VWKKSGTRPPPLSKKNREKRKIKQGGSSGAALLPKFLDASESAV
jgi:hypothetical protein